MKLSKHFSRWEFKCKGQAKGICNCGMDAVDYELIIVLEKLREHFRSPVKVWSGCRCPKYNRFVGGARRSKHKLCKASDITVEGFTPTQVYAYLLETYPNKYGFGLYNRFVHLDVRSKKARWHG